MLKQGACMSRGMCSHYIHRGYGYVLDFLVVHERLVDKVRVRSCMGIVAGTWARGYYKISRASIVYRVPIKMPCVRVRACVCVCLSGVRTSCDFPLPALPCRCTARFSPATLMKAFSTCVRVQCDRMCRASTSM